MAQVHQLIPCFSPGDAMGQAAIAWQRVLRHLGQTGEVYADEVAPAWRSLVRPASELRPAPDDLVLYHHGIASPLAGRLMHLPCRRGVVFHNVTPSHFYAGTQLEEALVSGRAQLAALADFVEVSIGVSRFNARELEVAGHRAVKVVPLFVEPERFASSWADARLSARLAGAGRPRVVSVSRVVPHKRMEDLLALHGELRRIAPRAELWVVGGFAAGNTAFKALQRQADALGGVTFLGRVSHAELVAAYRSADVFVSMSEHEGFGVPLVEAMAAEVPVLAFGAAAVPETMGGRGIVFDEKHFAALAELVQLVTKDADLRARLVAGQRERVAELSFDATRAALAACLRPRAAGKPVKASRPRVAVVVQRYGEELTGGAEAHARQVALHLAPHAKVEVLTTCAADHLTWANELPPGRSRDGAITVHRFPVRRPRRMREFNRLSDALFGKPLDFVAESHWLAEQGPLAPGLLTAIAERAEDFDAFLFFTYLYAPTAWGVPLVADKALVVPTAHDEPPLAFGALDDVFTTPRALLCNTPEEVALIERRFPAPARRRVVGVGIEAQPAKPQRFRDTFGLTGPYLLYLGRMEAGKGVVDLVRRHQALVSAFHDAPALVLAGAGDVQPRGTRVICVGRIDEQSKWDALAGALAVVVPSRYESLSLLALEAFAVGTPVIGNVASEVVVGQLQRSGGGVSFDLEDDASFQEAVRRVGVERAAMGRAGKKYAAKSRWDVVVKAYLEEIEQIREEAMKLLGRDITPAKVMAFVGERLQARGLAAPGDVEPGGGGVEARVDPLTFNLHALEANADATQGLPLETHREGLTGRAVVLAKRLFRSAGQLFINEALGRQRVFNGHVRDSYAQLSAEVMRLRQRVAELESLPSPLVRGEGQGEGPPPPKPPAAKPTAVKPPVVKPPVVKPQVAKPPVVKPVVKSGQLKRPPSAPRPPPRTTRRGK